MTNAGGTPSGWYHAPGDPEGTQRWWDGERWVGEPQASAPAAPSSPPPPPPSGGAPPPPPPSSSAPPAGYVAYEDRGPGNQELASPGQRIGARVIDWIIWLVVSAVLAALFGAGMVTTGGDDVNVGASIAAGLVGAAIVTAYEVVMVSTRGATLGKMALNLKVVEEDGSPATTRDALLRMAIYIASAVLGVIPVLGILASIATFVIAIVSLVFLFTDDRKQAVWDKVAHTIVVRD